MCIVRLGEYPNELCVSNVQRIVTVITVLFRCLVHLGELKAGQTGNLASQPRPIPSLFALSGP